MKGAILVLGAAGEIGGGVVAAALARGHSVIAVDRDGDRLQALRDRHADAPLHCLSGSVAGDAEGTALATRLRGLDRPLAGIVASPDCPGDAGRLLDRPAAFLRHHLDRDLLPHLAAARHLLPVLAEGLRGGSYVLVGGPGSDYPWAGYGHRSVAAAALKMLARVLHDEARAMQLRVQLLALDTPVCTETNRAHACPDWPSALAVGQRALAMVERCDHGHAAAVVHYRPDRREHPPGAGHQRCPASSVRQARALLDSLSRPPAAASASPSLPSPSVDAGPPPDLQKGLPR